MKLPKDYIIFALDVATPEEGKRLIRLLSGKVGMFKVGLELFIRTGPAFIDFIHDRGGGRVFLDLKLHDIPVTVERAVRRIKDLGVRYTSVHCGENDRMLQAAVEGGGGGVGILGITVLTSVSEKDIAEAHASDISRLVMKRAAAAKKAGCAGVVCSGLEVAPLKESFGAGFIAVTPGIRTSWSSEKVDQRRVCTPGEAILAGADYLVIGRPIRDARNPGEAAERIGVEIEAAVKQLE
jgi:orotidine-5'-phosphate decarboxylase